MTKNDFYIDSTFKVKKHNLVRFNVKKPPTVPTKKTPTVPMKIRQVYQRKIIIVLKIKKICVFLQRENND